MTSLYWSPDDTRLISAGAEGAVYRWRLSDLKRDDESVVKGCSYTCAISSPDYKTTMACGSDKKLKVRSDPWGGAFRGVAAHVTLPRPTRARTHRLSARIWCKSPTRIRCA